MTLPLYTKVPWTPTETNYETPLGTFQRVIDEGHLCPKDPREALKWVMTHFARHVEHTKEPNFDLCAQLAGVTSGWRSLVHYNGLGCATRPQFMRDLDQGGWWVEKVHDHAVEMTHQGGASTVTYCYASYNEREDFAVQYRMLTETWVTCTRYGQPDQEGQNIHCTCIRFEVGPSRVPIYLMKTDDEGNVFLLGDAPKKRRSCVAAVAKLGSFDLFTYHRRSKVRFFLRFHLDTTTVECFHGGVRERLDGEPIGWLNLREWCFPINLVDPLMNDAIAMGDESRLLPFINAVNRLVCISTTRPPVKFGGEAATRALHKRLQFKLLGWREQVERARAADPAKLRATCAAEVAEHLQVLGMVGDDQKGAEGEEGEAAAAKRQRVA